MTPLRVGIIGLGRAGWDIHARALALLPAHYRVAAGCDQDAGRREGFAAAFGARSHPGPEALLADPEVDLVVVASPSHLHADQACAALAAGKDVVCEKPMARNPAEAARMVAAARAAGRMLTVFHNQRYLPCVRQLRAVVASGVLGRLLLVRISRTAFARRWDWQTLRRCGGGMLANYGSHALDCALALGALAPGPVRVAAHLDRGLWLGDAEGHVLATLRSGDGPTVELELSSACAYPAPPWQLWGTAGGLSGGHDELRWRWTDPARQTAHTLEERPGPERTYARDDLVWEPERRWRADGLPAGERDADLAFYRDLAQARERGLGAPVPADEAARVVELVEAIRAAAG